MEANIIKLKTLLKLIPESQHLVIIANEKNFLPSQFQGTKKQLEIVMGYEDLMNSNIQCVCTGINKERTYQVIEVKY